MGSTRHCPEVGGGGGSIAEWLCQRVGASGRVMAIDIDTRFLDALDHSNLTVRRHDIVTTPLPEATFDLIHVRAVLAHIVGRKQAIDHMVATLKLGGRMPDARSLTWLQTVWDGGPAWLPLPHHPFVQRADSRMQPARSSAEPAARR